MSTSEADQWWQDCADVVDLLRKAASGDRDNAAQAVKNFLIERDAHEILDEQALVSLEAASTVDDLEKWLAGHELPEPRPWSLRVVNNVGQLLDRWGP